MPQTKVIFFRAEPRLIEEINRRAAEVDLKPSEFLRDLVRATLGLRPDYATNPGGCAETERSNDNLSYAK